MKEHPKQEPDTFDIEFEDNRDYVGDTLGKLVPQWLARRAIDASVTTNKQTYRTDEPVIINVKFRNRLPIPIPLETETAQLWGWTVDGLPAAAEEKVYLSETPNRIDFRRLEEKTFTLEWSGRFKRTGEQTWWEPADPGSYEISGFLNVKDKQVSDTTTIQIE